MPYRAVASLLLAVALAVAGRSVQAAQPVTAVYECPQLGDVYVQFGGDDAAVLTRDQGVLLARAPSASGARYVSGDAMLWDKAGTALIRLGGGAEDSCRANARRAPWADAMLRGIAFRAVGNAPSWILEISDRDRITLVTGDATTRAVAPFPNFEAMAERTSYRAISAGAELTVEIGHFPCADSQTGQMYPAVVRVSLEGRTLTGCGQALE